MAPVFDDGKMLTRVGSQPSLLGHSRFVAFGFRDEWLADARGPDLKGRPESAAHVCVIGLAFRTGGHSLYGPVGGANAPEPGMPRSNLADLAQVIWGILTQKGACVYHLEL